jgi:hypothetical protein
MTRRDLSLYVLGAGTAGFWVARTFARAPVGRHTAHVTIVDRARIREANAVTCPDYAGHVGRFKAERLAELTRAWFPRRTRTVRSLVSEVEAISWGDLLGSDGITESTTAVAVVGLDNWSSRVNVCEDLRLARDERRAREMHLIQIGLDRDQAAVAVFGSRWADPCPACGLRVLPESTPCYLVSREGTLVRGTLHEEAQAAAHLAARIARRTLAGNRIWVNTKTNLWKKPRRWPLRMLPGRRFGRFTRDTARVDGCRGPHGPATPLRWGGILETMKEGEGSHES